jgi:hypothetical protein
MLKRVKLGLTMTSEARERIEATVSSAAYPAIAGLLYGRDESNQEESWRIGLYDRHEIEQSEFGAVVIVLEDLELVIPQPSFLPRIDGMQLDWDGGRYSLSPRDETGPSRAR